MAVESVAEHDAAIAVRARGLTKRYGDLVAVDGIDFDLRRGTVLGVLGPNGAGKTTTIEMLEGLTAADGGTVTVLDRAWADDPRGIQERIGVQLQETDFQDKLTVLEILRLFRSFYRDGAHLDEVLDVVGLVEKRNARVRTLSGGQRQRLSIGCALLNDPELLFLDEPTTGLDPQARRRVWEIVERFKTAGGSVLLTTHYMEEAERLADDLIVLDQGRIIARGSPRDLIADLDVENLIEFILEEGAIIEAAALEAIDGVDTVRREGDTFTLAARGTQAVIVALFETARAHDARIFDLRTHRPTLEDVFVSLTGKTLRDEKTAALRELTRVRVLTFLREPEAIFWVFLFPLVLAAVLGFAFRSGGVEPVKVAVIGDADEPPAIVDVLAADEHLEVELMASAEEARRLLRRAGIDVVVEPADPPKLTLDPTRTEAATARLRIMRALDHAAGRVDPVLEEEALTEKGSRYIDFLFPGLIGMNLMGTGMWGIGFAIADFRRRKFLKRLLVTPMRKSSFFLSFMLSRLVFLVLEISIIASFGVWVLGVPLRGDLISFFALCAIGAFVFAGLGLLTASRARTIEGVSGLMNFIMMPMWLASGVFFSYERFPDAFHPFAKALPLTAVNDALRAVMIDGASLLSQGPELAVIGGWCVVSFVVALAIFRWE